MSISFAQLSELVTAWFWPFARIAAVISTAPVFGNNIVPPRVKLAVAMVITLVLAPVLPPMPTLDPISAMGLWVTVQQVVIGILLGLSFRLAFIALEIAGQLIAQLSGLGYSALIDPSNGINVPVLSQFYIIMATLIFLSLDGHHVAVRWLADSFVLIPIAADGISLAGIHSLISRAGWVFSSALALALPAMVALLTVNLSFGVMTRAAPQMNIIAVGFPVTLAFGFIVIWVTLPSILLELPDLFHDGFEYSAALLSRR